MNEEERVLQVCLDVHSKWKVAWFLFLMHRHGMIGDSDLGEFSAELQKEVRASLHFSKSGS